MGSVTFHYQSLAQFVNIALALRHVVTWVRYCVHLFSVSGAAAGLVEDDESETVLETCDIQSSSYLTLRNSTNGVGIPYEELKMLYVMDVNGRMLSVIYIFVC